MDTQENACARFRGLATLLQLEDPSYFVMFQLTVNSDKHWNFAEERKEIRTRIPDATWWRIGTEECTPDDDKTLVSVFNRVKPTHKMKLQTAMMSTCKFGQ